MYSGVGDGGWEVPGPVILLEVAGDVEGALGAQDGAPGAAGLVGHGTQRARGGVAAGAGRTWTRGQGLQEELAGIIVHVGRWAGAMGRRLLLMQEGKVVGKSQGLQVGVEGAEAG